MVAAGAVDTALHGVDEEASFQGGRADSSRVVLVGRKGALGRFVGDEFHSPEQTDSADVTDGVLGAQGLKRLLQVRGRSSGIGGVGGVRLDYSTAGGAGLRVRRPVK